MVNEATVQLRLYLRSTAVAFPLETLIRQVQTPSDTPNAVPLWSNVPAVLPYVDLQYGTQSTAIQQIYTIWEQNRAWVHTIWMRYSPPRGRPDELRIIRRDGHQADFTLTYRFDRVRVEWAAPDGTLRGVTQQRLRHPLIYRANNTRTPLATAPTRYGTRTTPSYGQRVTPPQVFEQFEAVPGVLQGENAHPDNTCRVVLSYGRHLVRVLHTIHPPDAPPYWQDFTLDDWDNIDNTPWRDYHNHYCGLA